MRVLLAEDDPRMARRIAGALPTAGIDVTGVVCGEAMLTAHAEDRFDALVLDLDTTGAGGLGIIARLRTVEADVPVLLITSASAVEHRVAGLNAGADDYLVKPFEPEELLARMRVALRRSEGRASPVLRHGDLVVDPAAHTVVRNGEPVALRTKEFALLLALLRGSGQVLSRQRLEQALYGFDEVLDSNALEVHMHHLRRKLGDGLVKTVRGVGYFVPVPEPQGPA